MDKKETRIEVHEEIVDGVLKTKKYWLFKKGWTLCSEMFTQEELQDLKNLLANYEIK